MDFVVMVVGKSIYYRHHSYFKDILVQYRMVGILSRRENMIRIRNPGSFAQRRVYAHIHSRINRSRHERMRDRSLRSSAATNHARIHATPLRASLEAEQGNSAIPDDCRGR